MTADVLIIGGGIVGTACADEASRAGLKVILAEEKELGGGATAAGMGHVVVMDDSEAQFALTRYSRQLWRDLAPELPARVEYSECGSLWIAADEEEMAEVRRKLAYCHHRGMRAEVLDSRQLELAEPNLRKGMAGALLVPEDSVVYPPCAARFLMERAQSRGAQCLRQRVTALQGDTATLADGTTVSAATIVNATGAGAKHWNPEADIQPRKGHLMITDRYPGFVRHQLIELGYLKNAHSVRADSVAFNVQPRKTGQVLIGSSRQFGVVERPIDPAMMSWMLRRAVDYMPALERLSAIRGWTGFRAATPDSLPFIGPSEKKHLWIAAGHEGLGITTSLGTARLLVDQLLGRPSAIPFEPYLPGRKHAGHHD